MGNNVNLISPGKEVANYLAKKLTADMRHNDVAEKTQYDGIENIIEIVSIAAIIFGIVFISYISFIFYSTVLITPYNIFAAIALVHLY